MASDECIFFACFGFLTKGKRFASIVFAVDKAIAIVIEAIFAKFFRVLCLLLLANGEDLAIGVVAVGQAIAVVVVAILASDERIFFALFGFLAKGKRLASIVFAVDAAIAIVVDPILATLCRVLGHSRVAIFARIIAATTEHQR